MFEPFSGAVRVLKDGQEYTDPYGWGAAVRFINPKNAEILIALKPPTNVQWRAVLECLGALGVETVIYKRYRDNGELIVKTWQTKNNKKGEQHIEQVQDGLQNDYFQPI